MRHVRTSRRRWLRWALGLLVCAAALAGVSLGYLILTSEPPREALKAATAALEGARAAEAPRYAKFEWEAAETDHKLAYRTYRRAEVKLLGFMDYDYVTVRLEQARLKAGKAADQARRARDEVRARAWGMVAAAEKELGSARGGLAQVPFVGPLRSRMAQAEIALAEAHGKLAQGDYAAATERASVARAGLDFVSQRASSFLAEYTTGANANRWQRWVRDTIEGSRARGGPAIIVDKMNRRCHLYRAGGLVATYAVDLGASPARPKLRAGDRATPEGRYYVTQKRGRGQTAYYKALMINFPNEEDRRRFQEAKRKGWISRRARIGGLIEIHGDGGRREDWTMGCVALRNADMDRLFSQVEIGTPVTIVGLVREG